ncbi:MAG TPA: hypothetical protein VMF06_22955 [Candidatus Limnocylindria bacterium]|jgi:hypothetical protein|nr:hypothetical protein [Candidatus Limnocylindria bacterium]
MHPKTSPAISLHTASSSLVHRARLLRRIASLAVFAIASGAAQAGLPEPGVRLYGTVALDGVIVTAANTDVTIEVRRTATGAAIASYQMGSLAVVGNFYSLKVHGENQAPLANADNVLLGSTLYVAVKDASGDRDLKPLVLTERGLSTRIDFGSVDTDADGMSDEFELANFGSATGGDPNADPDHDGRPNFREFLQGTNPNQADGRHPADVSPADNRLSLAEVTDYILAWKTGRTWPVEPALNSDKIEDYITRAGAIWKGGELYVFDNSPATNAPMWWVNPPSESGGSASGKSVKTVPTSLAVSRTLPNNYSPNQALPVTLAAAPGDHTKAYAVVEAPPRGWAVRNISHEGRWDAVNRKIKWGPFFDQTPRTLAYEAIPAPGSVGAGEFTGRGSFDGYGFAAAGPTRVWPPGESPAPQLIVTGNLESEISVILHGEAGRTYELQSSDDLASWHPGPSVTLDAQGHATVAPTGGANARFFRLTAL